MGYNPLGAFGVSAPYFKAFIQKTLAAYRYQEAHLKTTPCG
jgi:hypothetical protein